MTDSDSPALAAVAPEKLELRRDVSVWGSFMWGYADVGADIYTALGLVLAAAQGAAPLAFCLAGLSEGTINAVSGLASTTIDGPVG